MPYSSEWVAPEVAVEAHGVTVYHLYKNDEIENGPRTFGFGLSEDCSEGSGTGTEFDVRDLNCWTEYVPEAGVNRFYGEQEHIKKILLVAIVTGELTAKGVARV